MKMLSSHERSFIAVARLFAALVAFTLVSSCGGENEEEPEPEPPRITPGGCGLLDYEWLPAEEVGRPLFAEEDVLSPLGPEAIDALLAGYSDELMPMPYGARVLRMRYTTQDKGEPVEATGFVSVPWLEEGAYDEFPVVLWLHGTTGLYDECAPSRLGGEHIMAGYLLSAMGYVVVAPDYIGLDGDADLGEPLQVRHSYLGIEQTAMGSWDMVRAARDFFHGEDHPEALPSKEVVLWGGSQGGHAAFACDLLHPYYAPELDLRASIALIPPTDLFGQASWAFSAVVPTTAALSAFLVTQHFWYGEQASLDEIFLPDFGADLVDALYSGCRAVFRHVANLEEAFQTELLAAVAEDRLDELDPWGCLLRQSSIVHTPIPRLNETPTLVVLGEEDRLVYTPVERDAFDELCDMGYHLDYLECEEADHGDAAAWSLPEQIEWMAARLAGEPIEAPCERRPPEACSGRPD